MGWHRGELSFGILRLGSGILEGTWFGWYCLFFMPGLGTRYLYVQSSFIFVCFMCMSVFFVFLCGYSLALGLSCFIIVSATMRRWIFPVAVLGMLSVKYTLVCVSCVLRNGKERNGREE